MATSASDACGSGGGGDRPYTRSVSFDAMPSTRPSEW